jgi:predicted nucleic acid-binding protein
VLIDLRAGRRSTRRAAAAAVLTRLLDEGDALCTTRFNEAELRVGVTLSDDPERERELVEGVLDTLVMLDFEQASVLRFAAIKGHLRRLGRPSGDMDLLIAAVALEHGETLITRNPKHFSDIPGLLVESY